MDRRDWNEETYRWCWAWEKEHAPKTHYVDLKAFFERMESKMPKSDEERYAAKLATCTHFDGLPIGMSDKSAKCKAGVCYRELVGGPDEGWARRVPCTPPYRPGDEQNMVYCEKFQATTPEEIAARDEAFKHAMECHKRGVSSCCEAPLDTSNVHTEGPYKGHGPRYCSKCRKVQFIV